jgi:hypothetical protein
MRFSPLVVTGLGPRALTACGSQESPDAALALSISAPAEMPFHGPHGPGTEPIYVTFSRRVVVTVSAGTESRISLVRTRLSERASGEALTAESDPTATPGGGEKLELVQRASGTYPSSLYPGDWMGVTTLDVSHGSGRVETLSASFVFH